MTGRTRVILFTAALLLAASQDGATEPERYSNIRFDTGSNWVIVERDPDLFLQSANQDIGQEARILITAATPFDGTATDARDLAWEEALSGIPTRGTVTRTPERPLAGGAALLGTHAATDPSGGIYAAIVQDGSFMTRVTLFADTDRAYDAGRRWFESLLASIEIVSADAPLVTGIGTGGTGSVEFNWNGPGRSDFGVYDHNCLHYREEFQRLVGAGKRYIGSVQPATADWTSTLARMRGLMDDPEARKAYQIANEFASPKLPDRYTAGAVASLLNGDPVAALAQLLAGVEQTPDNADLLFNFAGALAQSGFANESLAVLDRLASLGGTLELAAGADPAAAIAYLRGYDEMLLGRLGPAKSNFSLAKGLDPFINEAGQMLALVEAAEGSSVQALETYRDSLWRFKPKQLVFCGASVRGEQTDEARPPVDDMFDTSMGTPGELVQFQHPQGAGDLARFHRSVVELAQQRLALAMSWDPRANQLSAKLDWDTEAPPEIVYFQKMSLLLETIDEEEPYVVMLREHEDAAAEAARQIAGAAQGRILKNVNDAAAAGREIRCGDWRDWADRAVSESGPALRQLELAQRRFARDWYKITTGLNAKIGDPDWHEFNSLSLRTQLEGLNAGMLTVMHGGYSIPFPEECEDAPDDAVVQAQPPADQGSPCSQLFGDLSVSHSMDVPGGPKFGFDVGCEKIKVDVEHDLLKGGTHGFGTALGGFASVEVTRKGDYSIFAGARGEASGPGMGGGVKSGFYLEGGSTGVTEIGGRVNVSGKAGFGQLSKSGSDDMKFNILPSTPKASRGPVLKAYR